VLKVSGKGTNECLSLLNVDFERRILSDTREGYLYSKHLGCHDIIGSYFGPVAWNKLR